MCKYAAFFVTMNTCKSLSGFKDDRGDIRDGDYKNE